jgi:hypothetical protein
MRRAIRPAQDGKEATMLTTQQRQQIETMIARYDTAVAAGLTISAEVDQAVKGSRAVLACNDPAWFASVPNDVQQMVMIAANGNMIGNNKLI